MGRVPLQGDSRGAWTLTAIGAFKLAKSLLLGALALGLLRARPHDLADVLSRLATQLQIDPEGRHLGRVMQAIAALDERRLRAITAGMILYAAVFFTEGLGLLLRKRWAEYFTAIVTGSFVPVELYELIRHPGGVRATVLLVNLAIVWYLVRRLRRGL